MIYKKAWECAKAFFFDLESQLVQKKGKNGRFAYQREHQPIDGTPEVGGVADVVDVPPGHVPAVQEVQGSEDEPRYRYGDHKNVDAHLGVEKDRCK